MITPIWGYELDLIKDKLESKSEDEYLSIFAIYFSLICSGNICMSLDKDILKAKWEEKINDCYILSTDEGRFKDSIIEEAISNFNIIKEISSSLYSYLDKVKDLNVITSIDKPHEMFEVFDNYLYLRKYNEARLGIIKSIERLYSFDGNLTIDFDIEEICEKSGYLKDKQKDVIREGLNKNLIVTGGPGTGKTTSILFLLIALLSCSLDYHVYLAAASGKAASRMKESIIKGISRSVKQDFIESHQAIFDKIRGTLSQNGDSDVEEFTIHRLLGIDFSTNGFKYNRHHQFKENSIFIIDEASMIDVCLFNSLLEAIKEGSRVFILGDKDQLPSVEVGSVFGDLVSYDKLTSSGKVITLDESVRFKTTTEVYKFAKAVNENSELSIPSFNDLDSFEILGLTNHDMWKALNTISYNGLQDDSPFVLDKKAREECKIKYYLNDNSKERDGKKVNQKDLIKSVATMWAKHFYKNVQEDATGIDYDNKEMLDYVFSYTEEAKILCAENEGIRGVKTLNDYIKKEVIKKKDPVLSYQYPGQVMMINKNNKALKLYNGDTGILVSVKGDNTIYFMVKKNSKLNDGYKKDEIFKVGDYLFYPLRLITLPEIDLSYAITVHKSQGSDYDHILVILPTAKGHPLLNRQILYTAVTRTRGYTYIVSNIDSLNEAKERLIRRDTNIK